jgi:prepilin-type N-terminal cleavage/methylation domain-containing protein
MALSVLHAQAMWRSRMSQLCAKRSRKLIVSSGFTLPELLVGLLIAGLVSAAAGTVMLGHMRSVSSLEQAQRQRDNALRFDYLVQIEAGESSVITRGEALPGDCVGPGPALFSFLVPRNEGSYQEATNVSTIAYYNDAQGNVRRCGPRVLRDGRLDHRLNQSYWDGVVVRGGTVNVMTNCQGEVSGPAAGSLQVVFRLVYPTGFQPACSIARARTVRITNPL